MLRVCLSICWLCLFFNLFGQSNAATSLQPPYYFQEQLAQDLVLDILQDDQGFMWFATSNGLIRYDGAELKIYRNIPGDTMSLAGDYITKLALGENETLWVGTGGKGLHHFDLQTDKFRRFQKETNCSNCLSHNRIACLYTEAKTIWIGTTGRGVNSYNPEKEEFSTWDESNSNPALADVNDILSDDAGNLWLATDAGLVKLDPETHQATVLNQPRKSNGKVARTTTLSIDHNGVLWCGTLSSGIFRYDSNDEVFTKIVLANLGLTAPSWQHIWAILPEDNYRLWIGTEAGLALLSLSENGWIAMPFAETINGRAASLYKSADGILWVGTSDGVQLFLPREKLFWIDSSPSSVQGIYLHAQANAENVWAGTYQGLFQYNLKTHRFHRDFLTEHPALRQFERWFISGLLHDSRNRLWITEITNFGGGSTFYQYDLTTKTLTDFSQQFKTARWYSSRQIVEDDKGNIWIGNDNEFGLLGYDNKSGTFKTYPIAPSKAVIKGARALHVDAAGFLWIGWMEAGLSRYDPVSQAVKHFTSTEQGGPLVHNSIWWIAECGNNQLCIGTEGGLSILDKQTGTSKNFTIRDGLLDAKVDNVLSDTNNNLWLTTRHGLYHLNPKTGFLRHYDQKDGMDFDLFVGQSAYQDASGNFYFGGNDGLVRFHPDSIYPNRFPPPVQLTRFQLFNKAVYPRDSDGILKQAIQYTNHVVLRHDQNVLTFDYVALSYKNTQKHQYAYWLENFEPDWQFVNDQKSVTYTNLDPGEYTLHIKAANADGIWSQQERQLQLTILPPWYWAWWSKTLYALALVGILYFIYRFQLQRRLEQAEAQRLQELDSFKTRLYTNITHEFRTPLTVISGMADQVLENPKVWFQDGLSMIKRNSQQLLSLVNQMLDLSKLEAGTLPVHLVQDDIIKYLKYLTESFHSYAETKNIRLHLLPELDELTMDYDPEKVQAIFSNLVSNAIKFTPEGGDVYIKIQQEQLAQKPCCKIRISDTGAGISEEQLPYIFDRFYQADDSATRQAEGTGIGLALTKELVQLLGGSIDVKSQLEKGTEFTVWLPIAQTAARTSEIPFLKLETPESVIAESGTDQPTTTDNLPLALLIEDNLDVLRYLSSCLHNQYRLETAINGEEGIQKAIEIIPDIIISDVMMPKKDGFEVVDTLKNDERTSHIPIILLTAKADITSRIEGLEQGADAYLAKPFDKKELEVRLRKLIELRQQLQARYRSLSPLVPTENKALAKEDKFLQKIRQLIEANLEDEKFGIPELCVKLGISRIQLHRKLKALTDQSTSHVIRSIRLQKARTLLQETDLTIAEVAYQIGFKSSNYFSQVFTSEFGKSPTAFRKK